MNIANDGLVYDDFGKMSLDHIYDRSTPRAYFSTLRKLDYRVPDLAKPIFQRLLNARRQATGENAAKIVDVGCSYGINAALLKHDMSLDDLYRLYDDEAPRDDGGLLARDQELFARSADPDLSVVGLDVAKQAVAYAVDAGMMDAGVSANLEKHEPSEQDMLVLENADMVISTGCVGYVTNRSLEHLIESSLDQNVWMANFVLRMFDYEPVEEMMAGFDYVTEKLPGRLFPQRRFVSEQEKEKVLDNLNDRGLSPNGLESEGWYMAELHVSRPAGEAALPLNALLAA